MRTLIFSLCFAVVSPAATIVFPALSTTLAGGEVFSLPGGTLDAPTGNGALSMTAVLDTTMFGTSTVFGQFLTDLTVTANGTPVTLHLMNHWRLDGDIGIWTLGLDRTTVASEPDGRSGFVVFVPLVLSVPLGEVGTAQAFAGYNTNAPEPSTGILLAAGIGAFALVRKRY